MLSVNWSTKVIAVPQSFLTFLSGDRWELDVDAFRLGLKDIEGAEEGMSFADTHRHNTQVTLSGVTYARTFEIINGYQVEFEDKGPHYTVVCTGANHNLGDVLVPGPVHLIIGNSAGLIVVTSGSGVTAQDKLDIAQEVLTAAAAAPIHAAVQNETDVADAVWSKTLP